MSNALHIRPYDVYFGYLIYGDQTGGKERPAIIIDIEQDNGYFVALGVYSYRKWFSAPENSYKYCEIFDNASAGLNKRSFVDVSEELLINEEMFANFRRLGSLSTTDIISLQNKIDEFNSF